MTPGPREYADGEWPPELALAVVERTPLPSTLLARAMMAALILERSNLSDLGFRAGLMAQVRGAMRGQG